MIKRIERAMSFCGKDGKERRKRNVPVMVTVLVLLCFFVEKAIKVVVV